MTIPGFDEFELDIEHAFRRDLPPFIDTVTSAKLTTENISAIPERKNGVYLLLEHDVVKYVGKTDSQAGFQDRLQRHAVHIQHRRNLDPLNISFKAVAIPVFKNADIETILIGHYGAEWNNSGFGSNDPGRNRDNQLPADFDRNHPIDTDIPLGFVHTGPSICRNLLRELSTLLPYTFRYEKQAYQDDLNVEIIVPYDHMTMNEIMRVVVNSLPSREWQCTVLFGRIILYPEHRDYPHFQQIIRCELL